MYFLPLSYVTIYSFINLALMNSMPWMFTSLFQEILPGKLSNKYSIGKAKQ
jgi:hypothetical protein